MPLLVSVQAQKDQVRLRQIDGKGAVGDRIDNEKPHLLRLDHQIPEAFLPVSPQKSLSAAEKQDPHAHGIQLLHLSSDLPIWMNHPCEIVDRAVTAAQIALVRHDNRAEDRILFRNRMVRTPSLQIQECGKFHRESPFVLYCKMQFTLYVLSIIISVVTCIQNCLK